MGWINCWTLLSNTLLDKNIEIDLQQIQYKISEVIRIIITSDIKIEKNQY